MNGDASNAVFISYRREAGGMLALALYQQLADHGLDAFYDIESIRAGQFDTIILNQIAARPYFLLVLTPGTLDRCREPKDWLRREIEQALSTERVIVPVHTPTFDYGDIERLLPESLAHDLQRFNGQELPHRWFKFAVQELVEDFLVPIELENVAPPAADQPVVDRLREEAKAALTVTETQLSAQEYFERALARGKNDLGGMITDYSEAIRLDPKYARAFNNRGIARLIQKGDLEGALADFDEAIRLDPKDAFAFSNRANVRRDQGDLEGALADYDEAIRLDPNYAVAFTNRAIARGDQGDLEGALADFDEAIRLDPSYAVAFYTRGIARRDQGDLEGALADYDEAIRLDRNYAAAFTNRGGARRDQGDLERALADLDEAIRLDPHDANAYFNRALVRWGRGELAGAIADAEQGAVYAPENEDFPRLLASLKAQV